MGNTWAADRRDKEPHTWLRHHHEASVKLLFPTCLDVICHPRLILIGAGSAMELRHCLDKPFQPQSDPPPSPKHTQIHTHTFTLLCMWDDLDACEGCGLKDRLGREPRENSSAQGVRSHPSMNTRPPPPTHLHPHLPPAFHAAQASLHFRAFECDSSGSPACDEPNSSGLPTHRVVSPSLLLILGSRCTQAEGLPVSDMERHTAKSPQLQAWLVVA